MDNGKSLSQELCELCGVEAKYCVAKYSYYMSEALNFYEEISND